MRIKLTVITFLTTICCSLAFFACNKTPVGLNDLNDVSFNASAAKEWFYGTFKKSVEYSAYNMKVWGMKHPDWSAGIYKKTSTMEIVEFPLVKTKSALFIPSANAGVDGKRIAEATLTHIAFIKTNGKVYVREVNYIPEIDYARKKSFDIGNNNLLGMDAEFSGRVIMKTWGEEEISRRLFASGSAIKRGRLKPQSREVIAVNLEGKSTNSSNCATYEICLYERECSWVMVGDNLEYQCEAWEPTGTCWIEEFCDGDPGCDPGDVNCQCEVYGVCETPEEPEVNCDSKQDEAEGTSVADKESVDLESETATQRTKKYKWVIFRQNWGLWSFSSLEKGTLEKTTNPLLPWKFILFEHKSVSRNGIWAGGTVSCTVNDVETYVGSAGSAAGIELEYTITASAICKGFPIGGEWDATSNQVWLANE